MAYCTKEPFLKISKSIAKIFLGIPLRTQKHFIIQNSYEEFNEGLRNFTGTKTFQMSDFFRCTGITPMDMTDLKYYLHGHENHWAVAVVLTVYCSELLQVAANLLRLSKVLDRLGYRDISRVCLNSKVLTVLCLISLELLVLIYT